MRAHRARRRRRSGAEGSLDLQFDPLPQDTAYVPPGAYQHPASATQDSYPNFDSEPNHELRISFAPSEHQAISEQSFAAPAHYNNVGFDLSALGSAAAFDTRALRVGMEAALAPELSPNARPEWNEAVAEVPLPERPLTPEPEPPPLPRVRRRSRKVIEFPRINEASIQHRDELAEPIGDQLRIFEALDDLPEPAPEPGPLADIRLESPEPENSQSEAALDLPLPIASVERRLSASLIDSAVLSCALVLFGAVAHYIAGELALTKPMLLAALGCSLLLLGFFESAFLFYSGATPGMRALGLVISNFAGDTPSRWRRLARALALLLSCSALALGLIWVLIDEDRLSWHDRITHTYLREA